MSFERSVTCAKLEGYNWIKSKSWCFGSSTISQQKTPVSLGIHCLSSLIKSAGNSIKPCRQQIIVLSRLLPFSGGNNSILYKQSAPGCSSPTTSTLNSGWETRSTITSKCHRAEIPSRQKHATVSGRSSRSIIF